MKDLRGQRILLIAPRFFGYEHEILRGLERRGATVDWLRDRPLDQPWALAVLRLFPRLMLACADRYYRKRMAILEMSSYDVVFAVNTVTLTPRTMRRMRDRNNGAKYIIYMWDSMENRPHVQRVLTYFDFKWCFDPDTATRFGMTFRPLFYLDQYRAGPATAEVVDLSFVGSVHADRYAVIERVRREIPAERKSEFFLFLRARWLFWAQRVLRPSWWRAKHGDFIFKPLSPERVVEIVKQSRAILDIEHPKQRGLTMRTLEALGAGKKIITTNQSIQKYDFFHPDNVAIINRNEPRIPREFWSTPFRAIPVEIQERYSFDSWLDEVLLLQE